MTIQQIARETANDAVQGYNYGCDASIVADAVAGEVVRQLAAWLSHLPGCDRRPLDCSCGLNLLLPHFGTEDQAMIYQFRQRTAKYSRESEK